MTTALSQSESFQRLMRLSAYDIARAIEIPVQKWAHQCHATSLAIARSGLFEPGACRVVRGTMRDVGIGQHSWLVIGHDGERPDAYGTDGSILDCTVWSYHPDYAPAYKTSQANAKYRPHGQGVIRLADVKPGDGEVIGLGEDVMEDLSESAYMFLAERGPLDAFGWARLATQPVGGWPSKEIITAMHHDDRLRALVPIDIVGNLTDQNPNDLYW